MLRSLFFSEREHSYQPVPSAEPAEQKVATAEHAEEIVVSAPWTTLQLDLVMKIAGHLADSGDWKGVAALLLTNKRFYAILTDDSQYGNYTMPVTIDKQRHYLPIKNINHVVLANYFMNIDQHQYELRNEVDNAVIRKRNADNVSCIVICATSILGCIACHVGTSLLCDWVVLPGIAKIIPGNCFSSWCPGEVFSCTYNNTPECYFACCCPCCCDGNPWLQMRFADLGFLISNLCAYNITAIIPDICGGFALSYVENKFSDYFNHKVAKKRDALTEVTKLALLSNPHKKISTQIIKTLFNMNKAICKHKNNRHQPPEVIRMEDVRTETVVPRRIKMN